MESQADEQPQSLPQQNFLHHQQEEELEHHTNNETNQTESWTYQSANNVTTDYNNMLMTKLKHLQKTLTLSEISGSLGDLGTLLPLLIGLSKQRSIALAPALFFGGVSNIITGLVWDIPMCVQPMKSIAAVALASGDSTAVWGIGTITASGILTGVMVLVLGVTGLIEVVNKIVPEDVVSGLQIGVGLRLAGKGIRMVADLGWVDGYDCILLGLLCSILSLFWLREGTNDNNNRSGETESKESSDDGDGNGTNQESEEEEEGENMDEELNIPTAPVITSQQKPSLSKRLCNCLLRPFKPLSSQNNQAPHPIGIYLFLLGSLFATITLATYPTTKNKDNENPEYDLPLRFFGAPVAIWAVGEITEKDWKVGLLEGAIPQLPLTTLNSVISVCALASSLYPNTNQQNHPYRSTNNNTNNNNNNNTALSRKEVAISVGLMNLLLVPFGSMPYCHGAGGLAGQHRFGARYGTSVVFLGLCKVFLAVFFGKSALTLLDAFPTAILGVMLVIAGQELATTGFLLLVSGWDKDDDDEKFETCDEDERDNDWNKFRKRRISKMQRLREKTVIATITTVVIVTLGKTHYGAVSGWVAHLIYGSGIMDFISWWRRQNRRS